MIEFGSYHVNVLALISLIVVWLVVFQILALLCAQLARGALAAWSLSLFGIVAIYLRKPNAFVRFVQFALPLVGAAVGAYWMAHIPPRAIPSLSDTKLNDTLIALAATLLLGSPRIIGTLRELRFPLWGEARFIDRVARGQATIAFTAVGRTYIRDRFGATPEEFVRIVRRRQTPLASGTNAGN
jgi:hypothetical protein